MNNSDPTNIIITGVGGQGNIFASQLVAGAAINEGWHASIGETYGASQRGGSVMSHVRLSKKYQVGPLISSGEAHIIVGFEPLETLRVMLEYGNPETEIIVNPRPTYPIGVMAGTMTYPPVEKIIKAMEEVVSKVARVPATDIAQDCGVALAQNVVMVGALAGSSYLPLKVASFEQILKETFSGDKLEMNLEAFRRGVAGI